ncbi:AAA family ATPase [Leptospira yasudae]|uniref:ATP-dependent nuclease n=2 Tax=Leptospira TaxID=171 RepID=UPI001C4F1E2C|nr:AAA family ATPase [Leptospira yasudae]MBW0436036.1 AAA family ATPase [Leptospira yasudae]
MYLERLVIKNFRSISELTLHFNKGLNIIIGENNSGKSTIVDVLRICFSIGSQRREIFVTQYDFYINKQSLLEDIKTIEFHLFFKVENPEETAWFNELVVIDDSGDQSLQLHYKYNLDERRGLKKVKYNIWGGAYEGQVVSPEVLSLLYSVYLDALRDAEQHLRPIRGNRLGQFYANIQVDSDKKIDKEKKQAIANNLKLSIDKDENWRTHVESGKSKINEHLQATSYINHDPKIDIDFLAYDFNKLVDNLKMQIPVYTESLIGEDKTKQKYFDLFQNGLGYNNLIYAATVLGDLKQRKEIERESYISLLIEEPEAHLHPQLQAIFFNYLSTLDKNIGIQIFITSHSPSITSKADVDSIIVLEKNDSTNALSLSRSSLQPHNKNYLKKFLDTTRSQMLFAKGSILVEGISEALLLPVFSVMIGEKYNIEKNGIELVNINGVSFEHFAILYNSDDENKRLRSKCSIVTDDDMDAETEEVSSRAKNAKLLEKNNLKVFLAKKTFEYELFITGNNRDLLLEIFATMHPKSASKIPKTANIEECGSIFLEKLVANKAKSEFSHRLSLRLLEDKKAREEFTVPAYIKNAIEYVIKSN